MNDRADRDSCKLPLRAKLGFGAGPLANQIMNLSMGFYLLLFYTDVIGLSGALIGVALSVGRFWDAITDPAVGHISDRTRSRFGRRRPYMVFGAPFLAVAFILQWCAPAGQSQTFLFAYLVVVQLVFYTFQTIVMVPYGALGAELTMDYHERTSLQAYAQGTGLIGTIIGSAMLGFAAATASLLNSGTRSAQLKGVVEAFVHPNPDIYKYMDGAGFKIAAMVLAPLVVGLFIVGILTTKENPLFQRHSSAAPWGSLVSTLRNRPFRIFIGAFLVATAAGQIGGFMLPYIVIHWLRQPGNVLFAVVLYTLAIFCGLPLWAVIARRIEKKDCFIASVASGAVIGLLFLALVRPELPWSLLVWAVLVGLGAGGVLISAPSMLADIIDTDELECGLRREGAFIGINNFILKCATSLGALWMGAGLSLIGYNGKAPVQSDRTLLLMRLLYVLPVVFNIFVIWVIARFPLTAQVMANVRRTIDARSAQPAAAGSGFIPYSADPNGGTPGTEQ